MIHTKPARHHRMAERPRTATRRRAALPARRIASPSDEHGELPLLEWIAGELQEADGLDSRAALRTAGRLLRQALAAADPSA